MISAGQLDQSITIQVRGAGQDALGQESNTWTNTDTMRASVRTEKGREYFAAGAVQAEAKVVFRVRYTASRATTLNAAMRVMWRGQPYDITAPPQDVDGKKVAIDIFCSTGMKDGR